MELTDVVPFLLEDELKKMGGIYSKGEDMAEYVVVDGLLITGQNPKSSAAAAELLLKSSPEWQQQPLLSITRGAFRKPP